MIKLNCGIRNINVLRDYSFTIGYNVTMLQSRRVFDLTNTIMNYLFMTFLLLAGFYLVSFWLDLKPEFLTYLVGVINVAAWTISGISVFLVILALVIALFGKDLRFLTLLWCLLRMAICIALSIAIDAVSVLVSEGVSITL